MWVRWNCEDGEDEYSRVVCLALTEDEEGGRQVVPMVCFTEDGEIADATAHSNFGGIVFSEDPTKELNLG